MTPIRIAFFGTPPFAAVHLRALLSTPSITVVAVITQPDRPAGRGKQLAISAVKEVAMQHQIPVLQPERIKRDTPAFLSHLSSYGPLDIGVVVAFGQILPADLLSFPKHGFVNVHASLLPRWRGAAPIQRAIMAGDTETGVCLMKMDIGLDTGPVYQRDTVPMNGEETSDTLHDRLAQCGAALLTAGLGRICSGELVAVPQVGEPTYAERIRGEEARIDWNKPAQEIERLVRGLSPAPGAFTLWQGKRLKIYRAKAKSSRNGASAATPGVVSLSERTALEIQCGVDTLAVEEAQLEGKRRMPIHEFAVGTPLQVGESLA